MFPIKWTMSRRRYLKKKVTSENSDEGFKDEVSNKVSRPVSGSIRLVFNNVATGNYFKLLGRYF